MINLERLAVHLPQGYLFDDLSVQINKKDRIGLVGKNGAGKSTLLKIIAGWMKPSEGMVHMPKDCQIGFLTQDIEIETTKSVFNYVFESNVALLRINERIEKINHLLVTRDDYESEGYLKLLDELNDLNHEFSVREGNLWSEKVVACLKGLGFADQDLELPLDTFSGGWKMRAELARILVNEPDALLLDEPTNHLDIISIAWLENYLKSYSGAVIVISHDRLFLDNVTNRTLEISKGKILDFAFAYSKYKEVRAEELERMTSAKKQQDKDIKHSEELINKFRAKKNKAAFAQSLIKKLEKMERIEVEDDNYAGLSISFPLSVTPGKWVLEMKHLGKAYDEKRLFQEVNLTVGRGEKIALLGANGMGKSTLLKCIMHTIDYEGIVEYGHNVTIGYFAQDQAECLDKELTVYETVDQVAKGDIRNSLRSVLGAFLFRGEDVNKKVAVLSGGERTRLALCQMLLSPSNFLILDEPTNHLDIQSKSILKDALMKYEGTFIVVSHDREFVDGLTNRIWDIENRQLKVHHYELKEFLDKKLAQLEVISAQKPKDVVHKAEVEPSNPLNYQEEKEKKREMTRLQNAIKKAEAEITRLELENATWEEKLATIDYSKEEEASQLLQQYEAHKEELERQMQLWEEASEELIIRGA